MLLIQTKKQRNKERKKKDPKLDSDVPTVSADEKDDNGNDVVTLHARTC